MDRHLEHGHHPGEIARRLEKGPQASYLRDWVYGGIDGTVTTFAIMAGVVGANLSAGVVIILGECVEGVGDDLYLEWMKKYKTPEKIEAEIRSNFVVGGHKAYAVTRLMKKAQFILVSGLDAALARTLLFTPARNVDEAMEIAFTKLGPNPRIILMPQGSLTVPVIKK